MSLSNDVAIVALIVSLAALAIAAVQLLQQLLGTAEGYRRCAPSVIGSWARLRHRRWNWTEFRFEVQYLTPHVTVLSSAPDTWGSARNTYGAAYSLTCLPDSTFKQDKEILEALSETIHSEDSSAALSQGRSDNGPENKTLASVQQNSFHDTEKQTLSNLTKVIARQQKSLKPRDEVRVSWLQLLRELHDTYQSHWPEGNLTSTIEGRTDAAVAIRQWNWDFMPADLLRPLATSTLNKIILLALRLNMQWRTLDIEKGVFLADGNGYSLTSVDMRGLGTTFQFNVNGPHDVNFKCVPSEAVDKMMFGIIPGRHSELVGRDYHLVSRKRTIESLPPRTLLQEIGIDDRATQNMITEKHYQEPHNELVMLLCPFLPLPGCPSLFNYFPAWTAWTVLSPFHFFEGRLAFVEILQDRVDSLSSSNHKAKKTLERVLRKLNELRQGFADDFYDRIDEGFIESTNNKDRIRLGEACSKVFKWTTRFFLAGTISEPDEDIGQGDQKETKGRKQVDKDRKEEGIYEGNIKFDWSESDHDRTRYVHLVAGQTVMAVHAISNVLANLKDRQKDYPGGQQRYRKHKEMFPYDPRDVGRHIQYHIAIEYFACLNHKDYGLVKYLRDKRLDLHVDYVEAAWWVLMLRGIVWDMSTVGDAGRMRRPGKWEGEPVPSSFYDITTPVWIT